MGKEDDVDRALFVRNLDDKVTEELLFELFLQAGPLVKTKIPKFRNGTQKTFGFAIFKHEVSVPYAKELLDGTLLFGQTIRIDFREGSRHAINPGSSQNSGPANTPVPHGQSTQLPLFAAPPQMQRSFSSPDTLQKCVMVNNMMWQLQMPQLSGGIPWQVQGHQSAGGGFGGVVGSGKPAIAPYWQQSLQVNSAHHSRSQHYGGEPAPGRNQHSYSHHDDRGDGKRHHGHQDNRRWY